MLSSVTKCPPNAAIAVFGYCTVTKYRINSNDFDLSVIGFEKTVDVLNEMKNNKFQVIYASAEQALSRDFFRLLRDESTELKRQLSLIVVDESHSVETW